MNKKLLSSNLITFVIINIVLLCPHLIYAKNLYVSTTGSDSVTYANNDITHPWLSPGKAFTNAVAGDIVYFRGGTYTLTGETLTNTNNNGTASNRITFRNYPGETPNIVNNSPASGGVGVIAVDSNYVTIDGFQIHGSNLTADGALIKAGEWHSATNLIVQNCHLHLTGNCSLDNVDCIYIKSTLANYALIQNNDMEGYTNQNGGVIIAGGGGGAKGVKILNNNIHHFNIGLYTKHINGDTSLADGAEWAYNYIYDIGGDGGVIGIPAFTNIHDNIIVCSDRATMFGINGGGVNGTGSLVNHNTFVGKFYAANESGGMINYTIKNNIMSSYEVYGGSGNIWDYNMYRSGSAIGAHDLANTSPTYTGGSTPSTIAGFSLTSSSRGHAAADDGMDMGANTTRVGIQTGGSVPIDTTPPTQPSGVSVIIIQ